MANPTRADRVGETFVNNEGCLGLVVDYINYSEVYVKFEGCGQAIKTTYDKVKSGGIKNPYHPSNYGIGFLGIGNYKTRDEQGRELKRYKLWRAMLQRCYDKKLHERYPTYAECEVCKEWHNYQNFAEWYETNYYEIDGEKMNLDKDILIKGNKIYSPSTCIFVPQKINLLFTKGKKVCNDLPIGAVFSKGRFHAICSVNGKQKAIGYFKTANEAFKEYKNFKENVLKNVAQEYELFIPHQLYLALINWEVEIND